ncbi:helix-turn-helix transcriptional regulator [Dehalococcoidia bacterium]|nr:helix-turn-helix transcriptional regulator [Dehalococcoidia bacterium]
MAAKTTTTSFDLLGKRWSALIVQELISGPQRFRELLNHLSRINDKVLSQRLKELEDAKILKRRVFAEVPIRVEYSLSDKGQALASVIREMEHWDSLWAGGTTVDPREKGIDRELLREPEAVGVGGSQESSSKEQEPLVTRPRRGLFGRLRL